MKQLDVVVIGAGPAGLSAGVYLARSPFHAIVVEKGAPGGKLLTVAKIENYLGFKPISGAELAQDFVTSATAAGVIVEYGNVLSVAPENGSFLVTTDIEKYLAKAVIVASGTANAKLGIVGEKEFLGRGVSYCATCDGAFYRNLPTAVYGRGDIALEEAIFLAGLVSHLYFFVEGASLSGSASLIETLKKMPTAEIIEGGKLLRIIGDRHVEKIMVGFPEGEKEYAVNGIFPLVGEKSSTEFLSSLPIRFDKSFIETDSVMMSSVPGIFAAGDVAKKKLRQVVTSAADGAVASAGVIGYLRDRK
jgi:thioredoxin reductase (NADPH)